MQFTFTEAQLAFRAEIRRVFMTEVSPELLRELWETDSGRSAELWKLLARLRLTGLSVPVGYGGLGRCDLDWVLIAQEAGYYALPEPLLQTAWIGASLLAALPAPALAAKWLPRIAAGDARLAIGHPVDLLVADAHVADLLLLHHAGEVHAVSRADVTLTRNPSLDPSRRLYRIDWQPTAATRVADAHTGSGLWADALNRGALGVAAQCSGLAMRMLDLSIDHSAQRKQFGKPIGSFQAVKHQLADVAVQIEFAKPVMYQAAYAIGHGDPAASVHISHARLAMADAALLAAKKGIQVHGAPGYGWDGDLQIFMKRAWALDAAWGSRAFHKARIADFVLREGAPIGSRDTFVGATSPELRPAPGSSDVRPGSVETLLDAR